jgi:hypothetical protein
MLEKLEDHFVQIPEQLSKVLHGYAFLLNVENIPDPTGVELLPGYVLRRAFPNEVDALKKGLNRLAPSYHTDMGYIWEYSWPHPGGNMQPLPMEDWRYFIIDFEDARSSDIGELLQFFTLVDVELLSGFTVLCELDGGFGFSGHPNLLFHALESMQRGEWTFHTISPADLNEYKQLFQAFQNHNHSLLNLRRITSELFELNQMPYNSPLRFLGYFALLEGLLTHNPKPTDPYDSITRQVKKKLNLLNHRFNKPIDYSKFSSASSDTIWSKMYSYRSMIAHGSTANFSTGELALLKSPVQALNLLRQTTKAVARHALVELQLIVDLKDC